MTRRERALAAIGHRTPDSIPVGFKATDDVLDRLTAHFGITDLRGLMAVLPVDTYGAFNNCLYGVYPDYVGGPAKVLYPDKYPDGSWDTIYGYQRRWAPCRGGRTDELITSPLAHASSIAELGTHPWPQADWFDYRSLPHQCRDVGDYAIVFNLGGLGHVANLVGFERMLTDMLLDPPFIEACFERLTHFYDEFLARVLVAAQGRIDIVCVQDDFGTQQAPLMSLDTYRRFYKPRHQRLFATAHRHNARVMMHSCGAVFEFIPEFIEIGADILDPLQINAAGMDPVRLKREFGKDLCFHGGIDTQGTLVNGTPDDVCRQIDSLIDALAAGGGYILAPSHYIQGDAPMKNVLAMFDHIARMTAAANKTEKT
jgi:uroporphyrinogen decarboxylase